VIDWSIKVGDLLTIAGFLVGGTGFAVAVRRDVSFLGQRLKPIEDAIKTFNTALSAVLATQARHDERLSAAERDLERSDPRQKWRQPGSR